MMKAVISSEMLVNIYQTTQHIIPEDSHLQFSVSFLQCTNFDVTMLLYWAVILCGLNPEDGDSTFHQNTGIYLQVHITSTIQKNAVIFTTTRASNLKYLSCVRWLNYEYVTKLSNFLTLSQQEYYYTYSNYCHNKKE
jgi:hypothetical protein